MQKNKVIVIVGPTASGKSSFAIKLAKKINGEIISCDSMQIYRGLDVGTAKVTKEEMSQVKHHLVNICDITDEFSVADFKKMCYKEIENILKQNKIPILVGGTGLYINSVVYDLNFSEYEEDTKVKEYRDYLYSLAEEKSVDYVYEMLIKIDKDSAKKIHKNNLRRVIRALEIAKFGNKVKSEHMEDEEARIKNGNEKYDFYVYNMEMPRKILYERINSRVDLMLENKKMLEEARLIYENKNRVSNTCKQAIGYKEFFPYFENEQSLQECSDKLKQATRNYAKRQITWFKHKLECVNIDATKSEDENIKIILKDIL